VAVIRTPVKAPNANAHAERWVRTIREECLDWLLIVGRRQLERGLRTYVDHYTGQRPHPALGLVAPHPPGEPIAVTGASPATYAERIGSAGCCTSMSARRDDQVYAPYGRRRHPAWRRRNAR
jgi:hypothetical protein